MVNGRLRSQSEANLEDYEERLIIEMKAPLVYNLFK
jgi:hypothetical protein